MPFLRISVPVGKGPDHKGAVGDAVHDAMVDSLGVSADDRFQVISEHGRDELLFDRGYLGVDRSDHCIFIAVTMKRGRTPAQKTAFYAAIAANLEARLGLRRQDVMVVLTENDPIDWSFGNGEAQLAGS
ncbi:tautomerase family protein [Roseospira visakhapatnamensis]|uniref:Phenylpyruvate tautomerase PptA (4-oxalocrotonate tautomerase family) n=1 Tax=Roseospira visakhapatnamensis TaxID=390880 RepID=A0A7W6R9M0_9PROT|nr:tautomerase family protein [Roseospira visakhapatnamensis]MBB4264490.1 phenylpyruvate tautomerase PptA (4-oxalocrotonate tautomerase family) [Roseospira visakhapatnamensis]